MLFVAFAVHSVKDVFQRRRIDVAIGEGMVRTDEHDGRIVAYGDGLGDVVAATIAADGRIFHVKLLNPCLAFIVMAIGRDLHEEHIVRIAAIEAIGLGHVAHDALAEFIAIQEEVDEHGLTCVKNVIEMDFVAINVGGSEIGDNKSSIGRGRRPDPKKKGKMEIIPFYQKRFEYQLAVFTL